MPDMLPLQWVLIYVDQIWYLVIKWASVGSLVLIIYIYPSFKRRCSSWHFTILQPFRSAICILNSLFLPQNECINTLRQKRAFGNGPVLWYCYNCQYSSIVVQEVFISNYICFLSLKLHSLLLLNLVFFLLYVVGGWMFVQDVWEVDYRKSRILLSLFFGKLTLGL